MFERVFVSMSGSAVDRAQELLTQRLSQTDMCARLQSEGFECHLEDIPPPRTMDADLKRLEDYRAHIDACDEEDKKRMHEILFKRGAANVERRWLEKNEESEIKSSTNTAPSGTDSRGSGAAR